MSPISRRSFLGQGAIFGLGLTALPALAQDRIALHMATVLPGRTGVDFIRASINEVIGAAARNGALAANIGVIPNAPAPLALDLIFASAPTPEAAIRAGERLVEAQGIKVLIGGVGEGQAEALTEVANRTGALFMNIGGSSDTLRAAGGPTVFHVEASDAMYLDALAQLAVAQGHKSWAVISDNTERGQSNAARAVLAAEKVGATVAGSVIAPPGIPVYYNELAQLQEIEADLVMVLLDAYDQTPFLIQYEQEGQSRPTLIMPYPLTQTRDYIASLRRHAPTLSPAQRVALWDATDPAPEAADFNLQIRARYAEPADPSAWAAYAAIKIVTDAAVATQSNDPAVLAAYMVTEDARFDLAKGVPLSFRPWDRQLRQPLAVTQVDPDLQWKLLEISTQINIAQYQGSLPADLTSGDAALDQLGDGPV